VKSYCMAFREWIASMRGGKHRAQNSTLSGPERIQHCYLYMYCICTVYVLCMHCICIVYAMYMYYICTVYILCMYCVCTLYYCICTVCVLYINCVCTVYVLYMYCVCTIYILCMYSVCTVYVLYMYFATPVRLNIKYLKNIFNLLLCICTQLA
jgi:hypothetical protein